VLTVSSCRYLLQLCVIHVCVYLNVMIMVIMLMRMRMMMMMMMVWTFLSCH